MSSPDNYAKFIAIQEKTNTSLLRSDKQLLEYKGVDVKGNFRKYTGLAGGIVGGVAGGIIGGVAGGPVSGSPFNPMTAWMGASAGGAGGAGVTYALAHGAVKLTGDYLERRRQKKANAAIDALAEKHGMTIKKRHGNINHLVGGVLGKGEHIAFHVPTGDEQIPHHTWEHVAKKMVTIKHSGLKMAHHQVLNSHGEKDLGDAVEHLDDYLTSLHEQKTSNLKEDNEYVEAGFLGGLAGAAIGSVIPVPGIGTGSGAVIGALGAPAALAVGKGIKHAARKIGLFASDYRDRREWEKVGKKKAEEERKQEWKKHDDNVTNTLANLRQAHGIDYKSLNNGKHIITGGPLKPGHYISFDPEIGISSHYPPHNYSFTHFVTNQTRRGGTKKTISTVRFSTPNAPIGKTYKLLDDYLEDKAKQKEGAQKSRADFDAKMKELESQLHENVNKYADYFTIQNKLDVGLLRNK